MDSGGDLRAGLPRIGSQNKCGRAHAAGNQDWFQELS